MTIDWVDLAPCWNCKGWNPQDDPHSEHGLEGWVVYCPHCRVSVTGPSKQAAFGAWNKLGGKPQ